MKYTNQVIISRPLAEVVEQFDSEENLYKWMTGLTNYEHLSGTPGQPGAKAVLTVKMGKREMQMTETILKRNLPEEFTGVYETPGVENIQVNRFEETTEGHTRYICETEFKFERLSMKIISKLFPGAFKKQSLGFMNSFKNFVEGR
jgi:uncharacterized membrane protein